MQFTPLQSYQMTDWQGSICFVFEFSDPCSFVRNVLLGESLPFFASLTCALTLRNILPNRNSLPKTRTFTKNIYEPGAHLFELIKCLCHLAIPQLVRSCWNVVINVNNDYSMKQFSMKTLYQPHNNAFKQQKIAFLAKDSR